MRVSLFYLPSIGTRDEMRAGMAGLDRNLYQRMLAEISEQARFADDLGYDSISFTEHHLHIEGFEISNNPVLLDLYVGMQTRRIRVGQLGIVLPTHNPLRVAEDIAMLDHMTGGRACAGFARGYQRRWVDVYGQQNHGIHGATPHQHDAIDDANRAAFEESFELVIRAWTEDLISHDGRFWKVPPDGTPWTLQATADMGAGIVDGVVRQVGVVPKPLQRPHPPIFQPFASSERSIRWCATHGVTAVLPPLHPKLERHLFDVYAEASGRPRGEGVGVLRDLVIADSDAEARALWNASAGFVGGAWFAPFGFNRGMADPDTGEPMTFDAMVEHGLVLVGTRDSVAAQLERLQEPLPIDWVFAWIYNGVLPHRTILDSLDTFANRIWNR